MGDKLLPKVLDADGVPYKIDDEVWNIETGEAYRVIGLPRSDAYQSIEVENIESGFKTGYDPNRLTHREPDSLEKLRDDLDSFMRDCSINADKVDEFTGRLTALMERGA